MQLIKFCLVGASSTVISQGILFLLLRLAPPTFPWWISSTISFIFGVTNGFYWNRRWTFAAQNSGSSKKQFTKFIATNIIGLILNLLITKVFLIVFTGQTTHGTNPNSNTIQFASLCAIPIVVIWNFSASRFWTFRAPRKKASEEAPDLTIPPISLL